MLPDAETDEGARALIARRSPEAPAERDYYLAWGAEDTPIEELATMPGARWRVEEAIKLAGGATVFFSVPSKPRYAPGNPHRL